MSLNSPEIDQILAELALDGNHIQKVIQPDFRNLYLQLFSPPEAWWLRICLENPRVRFHRASRPPRLKRSHQRFEAFLWSRTVGGRIQSAEHLFGDRIVLLRVMRAGQSTNLYLRLWGTRANIVATHEDGTILDAFFRKPNQGIETGARFVPEPPRHNEGDAQKPLRTARPIPDGMSLNETVETQYRDAEREDEQSRLRAQSERLLSKRLGRLRSRLLEVEGGAKDRTRPDQLRHFGDLLLANIWRAVPGAEAIDVEDYLDDNRIVRIPLESGTDVASQAQLYYERAKRVEESRAFLEASAASLNQQITLAEQQLASVPTLDLFALRELTAELKRTTRKGHSERAALPGLEFTSGGFRILVGRNARENDALLRRYVRGNDWWMHTRDHAGGYVFVKQQPGKSIPLEVLLDAGTLAVFFSKARRAGKADLYYTQVKYLRRAKDGPVGLVLPTQERNLSVTVSEERLAAMGIGSDLAD